jgi:hypothetical protein
VTDAREHHPRLNVMSYPLVGSWSDGNLVTTTRTDAERNSMQRGRRFRERRADRNPVIADDNVFSHGPATKVSRGEPYAQGLHAQESREASAVTSRYGRESDPSTRTTSRSPCQISMSPSTSFWASSIAWPSSAASNSEHLSATRPARSIGYALYRAIEPPPWNIRDVSTLNIAEKNNLSLGTCNQKEWSGIRL